mmetsp:Transcript_10058/g.21336  ORF Transcript_10058/g.21336 Transcript_10058/m.21336 type:complete len:146 (-) Transcript_10058:1201-1638(-)
MGAAVARHSSSTQLERQWASTPYLDKGAVWRASLWSPSVRAPALTYLVTRVPRPFDVEGDSEAGDLTVSALRDAIADASVLTQRGALDFCASHLPLEQCDALIESVVYVSVMGGRCGLGVVANIATPSLTCRLSTYLVIAVTGRA